jgi:predicted DNA-binding WGR domain protein
LVQLFRGDKMLGGEKIYLECVIPEKNRNAFYRLMSGQDLFGFKLIRTWGRRGSRERIRMQERFDSREEMKKAWNRILMLRLCHGYIVKSGEGLGEARVVRTKSQKKEKPYEQEVGKEKASQRTKPNFPRYNVAANLGKHSEFNSQEFKKSSCNP